MSDSGQEKFFYANGAEMAVSAYDLTLKFLRNGSGTAVGSPSAVTSGPTAGGSGGIVLDMLSVAMSPSHAKTMMAGMIQLLAMYEDQHGPIPLTEDAKKKWREVIENAATKI